jgi:hypothetical protein
MYTSPPSDTRMSDNHQIALDPYELEYELAELEKELSLLEKICAERPSRTEFLSVKANVQIQIDQKLTELGRPTRYYAKSELKNILNSDKPWPTIPRDSYPEAELEARAALYSAPSAIREPSPKKIIIGGCETYTLDGLIQRLQDLRAELGGSAPVWRDITDGSGIVLVTQPIRTVKPDFGSGSGAIIV